MLKLQNIHISFPSKTIFNDTDFIANPNEITVLIGESGTGKTTLFNTILLKQNANCHYYFYDEKIEEYDAKQKEEYLLNHISYASQKPIFIADLKMMEQIELLKKIYQSDFDVTELIQLFKLEKVLYSYPNQLSGGEKSRFSFIMALLKDCELYLFDEPTSALDDVQTTHIIEILNRLKEKGKIIVLSTHDHRLIQAGDKVYEIENQQLNVKKENASTNKIEKQENTINYSLKNLGNYWHRMKKHHKYYHMIMKFVMALGIIFGFIGIEFGFIVSTRFEDRVSKDISDVLLVSKSSYKNAMVFDAEGGFPFEEKEIKKIKEIEHIQSLSNYMFYIFSDAFVLENKDIIGTDGWYDKQEIKISLYDKINQADLPIHTENDTGEVKEEKRLEFSTYPNEMNLGTRVNEEWNDEGLYVSMNFYLDYIKPMIKKKEDKKEVRIEFPFYVPIYNVTGNSFTSESSIQRNHYSGVLETISFKVKGVLTTNNLFEEEIRPFGVDEAFDNYLFALSNEEMQKIMDRHKKEETHTCMYVMELDKTICDQPFEPYEKVEDPNLMRNYKTKYTPYSPNALIVQVEDVSYLKEVNAQLKEMGFQTYNESLALDTYETAKKNANKTVFLFGMTAFFLILLIDIFLKFNNREEENSLFIFFKEKGFTNKMISKLNRQRFIINCMEMTSAVILEFIVAIVVSVGVAGFNMFSFGSLEILAILMLIIVTEWFIPMVLNRCFRKGVR